MGIWDKLTGEFIDVIEWIDDSGDAMMVRFERHGNEIKYGAMLTVRESQLAVFVNEGQIADTFPPGMYQLETRNMPIMTTLNSWKHGFNSPFKAEVYFFNTKKFTDLKWGTRNPIMLRDEEFGPTRLRAFGTYNVRITEPATFIKEVAGTDGYFTTDEIQDQFRNHIVSRFASVIGEAKIPALDLAANYDELGKFLTDRISPEFDQYGVQLNDLLVENISLPEEVEKALDKRTSMGVVGDLDKYTKFQTAEAIGKMGDGEGGSMAGAGMGAGLGFALAQQMGHALQPAPQAAGAGTPPPLPKAVEFFVGKNGKQDGPYDITELEGQVKAGKLMEDSLIWAEGMDDWMKAAEVVAVQSLFGKLPPPLPEKS